MESNQNNAISKLEYKQAAKKSIHMSIKRDWYLWQEEREMLDKWYVLKWSQQYFVDSIRHLPDSVQRIKHDSIQYQIYYKEGYEILARYTDQVMISFRRLRGQETGIALVRTANKYRGKYHG